MIKWIRNLLGLDDRQETPVVPPPALFVKIEETPSITTKEEEMPLAINADVQINGNLTVTGTTTSMPVDTIPSVPVAAPVTTPSPKKTPSPKRRPSPKKRDRR